MIFPALKVLSRLTIRNLAILPELQVEFGEGLNVLTGETGAGKSILVDAISLLAGRRASADEIRAGETMAMVEAVLRFSTTSRVHDYLHKAGILAENGEVIIRRTISSDGRSRILVNDAHLTVAGLGELAAFWIDLSNQHGQLKLLSEESQTEMLDAYCKNESLLDSYRTTFHRVIAIDREISEMKARRESLRKQEEFLRFRQKELASLSLRPGEEEELLQSHGRLAHASKLAEWIGGALDQLDRDGGAADLLGRAQRQVQSASAVDSSLSAALDSLETSLGFLKEASVRLSSYQETLTSDPAEIERIDERLARLQATRRKFGSIEAAISELEQLEVQLGSLEHFEENESAKVREREEAFSALSKIARDLSDRRIKGSKIFSAEVTSELKKLGMPSVQLRVRMIEPFGDLIESSSEKKSYGRSGTEAVEIELAPNPGEGFKPLGKIASGGELSRILLAVKGVALNRESGTDLSFLFDEVDTGIGGETAERVGIRLKALSESRQVLCVTHLAQVACYADHHLKIEKMAQKGRTLSQIRMLATNDRVSELARMLGGIEITPKTMDHASELLGRAGASNARV